MLCAADRAATPRHADKELGRVVDYYEAALQVLRSAAHPLTAQEITNEAVQRGLISPRGRTPHATMRARLYTRVRVDPELVKIETLSNKRAKPGSVRWTLRGSQDAESK